MMRQAISMMVRHPATMAFCLPRLRAWRRYRAPGKVSVLAAVMTATPVAPRRYGLPLPVRRALLVAPDWMARGVSFAQEAACPGVGNWVMPVPSSATMTWAAPRPIPVISSSLAMTPRDRLAASGARPVRPGLPAARAHAAQAGHVLQLGLDPLVQLGDLGGQVIDEVQQHADLETVDVAEPAGQGLLQLGLAGVQPVIAERGQRGGAALAVHQGLQEPAAAAAHQVRDHAGDLQQGILQDLLDPVLVTDPVMGQVRPQPGQRPQVADGLRRHERAAQHAPFTQLAQPHAVQPVFSELRNDHGMSCAGWRLAGPVAVRPAALAKPGMPRLMVALRRAVIWFIWASLSLAPARLTFRPSASPSQRASSASVMRAVRLPQICSRRGRWAGSGRSSGQRRQECS